MIAHDTIQEVSRLSCFEAFKNMVNTCFKDDCIPKETMMNLMDILIKKHRFDIDNLKSDMDKAILNTTQKIKEMEENSPSEIH